MRLTEKFKGFGKETKITEDYSEICDVDKLIKKLADESAKIANSIIIMKGTVDDKLEPEIRKFVTRLTELLKDDYNILQKWMS